MPLLNPVLKSAACLERFAGNPVLTHKDLPYPGTCVFNAGVAKFKGKYVMLFRNDVGEWGVPKFGNTNLGLAYSDDGIKWAVENRVVWDQNDPHVKEMTNNDAWRLYDPRMTIINDRVYICFACDTHHGLRGGIAVTDDFKKFEILSLSVPDNRNMALFPQKIGGKYIRVERPMPVYSRGKDRFDMWISDSKDLKYWGNHQLLAAVENFPYANDKIGPAAPPIKTKKGWLLVTHCVDRDDTRGKNGWEDSWKKRYTAGIMLLDLKDPRKVIGISPEPLIAPETPYETDGGFRDQVIFPCGCIAEDDGTVKIYYGAADTYVCLATAKLKDLIDLCKPVGA